MRGVASVPPCPRRVRTVGPAGANSPVGAARLLAPVVLVTLVLAGCDPAPGPTPPASAASSTTSTAGSATPPGSSTAPSTTPPTTASGSGTTAPPATGPATPAVTPGTFTIVVSGAGEVSYPVTGVSCSGSTVTGTATPADGGTPGTLTLDTTTGGLTVAGLPPLDGTRLTGSTAGAPGPGATVDWTGDGTGAAASWQLTCP